MKNILFAICLIGLITLSACTFTTNQKIDLANCKEYFDGCNTCDVVNGETTFCTEKYCMINKEPKCLEFTK